MTYFSLRLEKAFHDSLTVSLPKNIVKGIFFGYVYSHITKKSFCKCSLIFIFSLACQETVERIALSFSENLTVKRYIFITAKSLCRALFIWELSKKMIVEPTTSLFVMAATIIEISYILLKKVNRFFPQNLAHDEWWNNLLC